MAWPSHDQLDRRPWLPAEHGRTSAPLQPGGRYDVVPRQGCGKIAGWRALSGPVRNMGRGPARRCDGKRPCDRRTAVERCLGVCRTWIGQTPNAKPPARIREKNANENLISGLLACFWERKSG